MTESILLHPNLDEYGAALPTAVERLPLYVYSHSWLAMDGMNTVGARSVDRLVSRLSLGAVTNRGVDGSSVQDVANRVIGAGGAPWVPNTKGLVLIQCGGLEVIPNNGGLAVAGVRKLASIEENLRAVLLAILGGTHDEIRAASGWTFSGTWGAESVAEAASSASNHTYTTTQNSAVFKNLAAGDYAVHLVSTDGVALTGGTAEILVEGVVVHTVNLNAKTWDNSTSPIVSVGRVARKVTIPVGGAELRIRKSDVGAGFVVVDFVAPLSAMPPEIFVNREVLGSTNDNDQLQAAVDLAVDGLDHVNLIDLRTGWVAETMFGSDGIHPNDLGSSHVASRVAAVMRAVPWRNGMNTLSVQ